MGEQGLEDIRLGEVRGAAWAADAFQMLARVVLESGEEIHGREIELRQDGRDCTLSVDIRYVQKQPTLLLLSIEDITERRASERALQNQTRELARSNAVLEQFAYAASHDLREPLRMITSYTQLLKRKLGDGLDPTAEQYFQFIVEGSTRMGSLLSSMLDFARAGHDVPRAEIESKTAAQNATRNLQALIEAADAKVEILEPLPKIHANLGTLTVIFQNLIANGIKYQANGKPHVRISAQENGEEWIFRVQDNGIGIHPEDQERIFGLFKRLDTRKYPGEGIGLSVCLRLIEQYGGRIWVESEVGRGSTFLFALPK
jgi:light-regulated signal transduction histidine kinase (bacteriophytochrome)